MSENQAQKYKSGIVKIEKFHLFFFLCFAGIDKIIPFSRSFRFSLDKFKRKLTIKNQFNIEIDGCFGQFWNFGKIHKKIFSFKFLILFLLKFNFTTFLFASFPPYVSLWYTLGYNLGTN